MGTWLKILLFSRPHSLILLIGNRDRHGETGNSGSRSSYLGASDDGTGASDQKKTLLFLNAIGTDGIEFLNTVTFTEEEKVDDVPRSLRS